MARRRTGDLAFSLFSFQDIITSVTGIMILITLILALELLDRVEASPASQNANDYNEVQQVIQQVTQEVEAIQDRLESARKSLEDIPTLDAGELTRLTENLQSDSKRIQSQINSAISRYKSKQQQLENAKETLAKSNVTNQGRYQKLRKEIDENKSRLKKIMKGNHICYKKKANGKRTWLLEITGKRGFRVAPLGVSQKPRSFTSITDLRPWAIRSLSTAKDEFLLIVKPGGEGTYSKFREQLGDSLKGGLGFDIGVHLVAEDQIVLDDKTGAGGA